MNGTTSLVNYSITIPDGDSNINLSSYGLNYVYYNDSKNSSPLVGYQVNVTYPNDDTLSLTTDSEGKIYFPSASSNTIQTGNYQITFQDLLGYETPYNFNKTVNISQLPFNVTQNITRADLTINLRDAITNDLITENVTVAITDIGTFTTINGTLFFSNVTFNSQAYTITTTSQNYTYSQKVFTYTNQEDLNVSVYMYNTLTANVGSVTVSVYDSFLDIVQSADVRMQEFDSATSTFQEIGSSFTNSNGQSSFQVLLEGKTYRFLVTKTIDGVTYQEYSSEDGEVIFIDGSDIPVYLDTIIDYSDSYLENYVINVSNTTLVNNISYHQVSFYDNNGLDQTVCLAYNQISGLSKVNLFTSCVSGSSGTINYGGGYDLTSVLADNRVEVEVYINTTGTPVTYYSQIYVGDNSFESLFAVIIKPLILLSMILALGLSLKIKRIDYFVYLEIFLSVLWLIIAPSYVSGSFMALNVVLGLMILFLAQKKNNMSDI